MKIINCEQGTEEWFNCRLGKATASNFDKVITSTGKISEQLKKYAYLLASEMLAVEQEETYKNEAMQRGNELEPLALEEYELSSFNPVEKVGFISCGEYGSSPDGLVDDKGLIEIKCPNNTTHTKYLYDNKLPIIYKAQVQGNLFCTERDWCDFVSFNPNFKEQQKLLIVKVYRDEKYIKSLEDGLQQLTELKNNIYEKIKNR